MKIETKAQMAAIVYTLLEALNEAKGTVLGGVPNGHLYAQLMETFDIYQWEKIINLLLESELAKQENYLLTILPKGEKMLVDLREIYNSE